ncbi:Hsp20/alpha crystallin family protein [Shimazuella sp. AN120528]|uniref:Hsp20/alpha crystallin family protein n=1 Tax=Shimazuella soli TaxID=1892854 RepID=UPI001F10D3AA|nr:Hsp20/alpha crystallin family protein [Shimazuella soli]MCH5584614.1 Hsp20/alpha crystallin family protein [Shimazuella soli]
MSLLPYDPFRQLSKQFDRLFSDFPSILGKEQQFGEMQVDVQETEKEVIATCKIPGLTRKEDVNIQIENDLLMIRASINKMVDIREENMFRRERYAGRFHRSLPLPSPVSHEGMKTSYHDGVLEVRMPKVRRNNKQQADWDFY